jgi:integrase/recombinase XerD
VHLFLDCGIRVSEAVELKLEHVDLVRGIILLVNTKGRVDRSLGMNSRTRLLLRKMLSKRRDSDEEFLFVNRSGKQYTRSGLSQVFIKLKNRAGVVTEGKLHGMRRTCITTLAKNGVDIPTIQRISGHKNPKTLIDRYISIDNDHMIHSIKTKGAVQTLLP